MQADILVTAKGAMSDAIAQSSGVRRNERGDWKNSAGKATCEDDWRDLLPGHGFRGNGVAMRIRSQQFHDPAAVREDAVDHPMKRQDTATE